MGIMRFLTANVNETWYCELENTETFYTQVTDFKMMEHLIKRSGCRHSIDAVGIMCNMQQYFNEAASITDYINMMEAAQKKAA